MYIFIFEFVCDLTSSYHSGGGLVVIARDEDHVKELVATDRSIKLASDEWASVVKHRLSGKVEPTMYVFPDAGCC
jgi:hypothetical protein